MWVTADFIISICCFSSLSTGLNSMAAVALEDFYKTFINDNPSNRESNILMKSVVVVTGVICVCLVHFVEKLGSVLQVISIFFQRSN